MLLYKNKSTGIYHIPGPDGLYAMCGVELRERTFKRVELDCAPLGMGCIGCAGRASASRRTGKNYAQVKKSVQ